MPAAVPEHENRVESGRYLRALREHWPYILGTIVLAVVAALVLTQTAHKRYEASTDVLVTPVPSDSFVGVPLLRESTLSRSVVTAARIVGSPAVVDAAIRQLGLDVSRKEFISHVAVSPQQQSSILTITGKAGTPKQAAQIANAVAAALIAHRTQELQRPVHAAIARLSKQLLRLRGPEATAVAQQLSSLRTLAGAQDPTLQVVSAAVPPEAPAWPRPVLSVAVALIAGLLLGMGIAVGLELANPLVLTETDAENAAAAPVIARIPRTTVDRIRRELADAAGGVPGRSLLALRAAWESLAARAPAGGGPASVLVTTPGRKEDGAAVATGLAAAAALMGRHVVLIDADARSHDVERLVRRADPASGMRAALDGVPLEEVLVPVPGYGDRLRVLFSSAGDDVALALAPPEAFDALAEDARHVADVVVVSAPPPLDAPEVLALAAAVDVVVVAVQTGRTRREQLVQLRRDLAQRGCAVGGLVVTSGRRGRHQARPIREQPSLPTITGRTRADRETATR